MPKDIQELEGLKVKIDDVIYMPSLDAPPERPHPFVYFISIFNHSQQVVSIRGRKWVVVEENGETTVVEGDGVVGQQPCVGVGDHFSYNSYHVVAGDAKVFGAFFVETESGQWRYVKIPEFRLIIPSWA